MVNEWYIYLIYSFLRKLLTKFKIEDKLNLNISFKDYAKINECFELKNKW